MLTTITLRFVFAFLVSITLVPLTNANDIQDSNSRARQAQLDYETKLKDADTQAILNKEKLDKSRVKKLIDRDVLKFCKDLGDCRRGEIGPAGGFIFYVAPEPTQWGRYIEVIDTQRSAFWCDENRLPLFENASTLLQTKIGMRIGVGKENTELMDAACSYGAAKIASEFEYGGFDDWYLPSLYELNEICKFIRYQEVNGEALCLNLGVIRPFFKAAYEPESGLLLEFKLGSEDRTSWRVCTWRRLLILADWQRCYARQETFNVHSCYPIFWSKKLSAW